MKMPLSDAGHRAPHVHPVWATCAPPARTLPAWLSTAAAAGAAGPWPARGALPSAAGELPGRAGSCQGFKSSGSLTPGWGCEFPLSGAERWALQALPAWEQPLPAPAAAPSPAMLAVAVAACDASLTGSCLGCASAGSSSSGAESLSSDAGLRTAPELPAWARLLPIDPANLEPCPAGGCLGPASTGSFRLGREPLVSYGGLWAPHTLPAWSLPLPPALCAMGAAVCPVGAFELSCSGPAADTVSP